MRFGAFFGLETCAADPPCQVVLAAPGIAAGLHFQASTAPGVMGITPRSWTLTVLKNGVATLLSCTISGAVDTSCTDPVNSVMFVAGDRISVQIVAANSPSGSTTGSWGILYG